MYAALFLFGYTVFEFERTEFSEEASFLSKYSGMISNLLLALGCFYEIYFEKPKSSNEWYSSHKTIIPQQHVFTFVGDFF